MIYKFTSVKNVLEGLYRDLHIQEEINYLDVYEWIGEALEAIGVHGQFSHIVQSIDICNFRAELPCNFHKLLQINYLNSPLVIASSTFNNILPTKNLINEPLVINGIEESFPQLIASNGVDIPWTYTINNNFIFTNFNKGTISMSYVGIPVDEEGFPLVPDNYYFIRAMKAYVTMKLDYIGWRTNKLTKDVYKDSEEKWEFYCMGAKGAGLMPNIDKAESIKNQWVRLKPRQNEYDSFFQTLGQKERLKRK